MVFAVIAFLHPVNVDVAAAGYPRDKESEGIVRAGLIPASAEPYPDFPVVNVPCFLRFLEQKPIVLAQPDGGHVGLVAVIDPDNLLSVDADVSSFEEAGSAVLRA